MKPFLVSVFMSALVFAACPMKPPVVEPTIIDAGSDAHLIQEDIQEVIVYKRDAGTPCARACATLSILGCPEAETVLGGDSCPVVCASAVRLKSIDPECIARAFTVEGVRSCGGIMCVKR